VIRARRARARPPPVDGSPRERLLQAAFAVFSEHGFAGASTLEIATRAQVSKRDLYALFYSKQAMLAASIAGRARRMRQPLKLASQVAQSHEALEATLVQFGKSILHGLSDPSAGGLPTCDRLIGSGNRTLHGLSTRPAARPIISRWVCGSPRCRRIGAGNSAAMAAHLLPTLGGALPIQLPLRVRNVPTAGEIESRARIASESLILLYLPPRGSD
jgi:AcrR family transcriptional regulator